MYSFASYITEEKNTHMEHLEDSVINYGVQGARDAINFLQSLRDMLAGDSKIAVDTTVKWDGAPAIFAGIDPTDGKFFVAKKGIFNTNPKIYKTDKEIDLDLSGDLASKFKLALKHIPEIGIKSGVIQGDFMYSHDTLISDKINGESVITFHPNTIVYSVPKKSELGQTIMKSKIGIVWHTLYKGNSFENMSAIFGQPISTKLKKSKNVWHVDATFQDVSGKATMTKDETKHITKKLAGAGKAFRRIDSKFLKELAADPNLQIRVKAFINANVRAGQGIKEPKQMAIKCHQHIGDWWDKQINKIKTPAAVERKTAMKMADLEFLKKNNVSFVYMFALMKLLVDAKEVIISKMDQASTIDTLLKVRGGYTVTAPEGYVAINRRGNAIKLVNRLEFSRANFSDEVIKGWQK